MVGKPKHKASWEGGIGFVSKEQVQKYLPGPSDDSLVMVRVPQQNLGTFAGLRVQSGKNPGLAS